MKTYIVQLETHDDIISAQDKISWSKARRVLLVWPRRGRLLERQVDLLLLLRHAQKLGAQIALISGSSQVKTHARELGIPVFKSTAQAQKSNWLRLHTRRRLPFRPRSPADPIDLRQKRDLLMTHTEMNRWVRFAIFLLGLAAFLSLALFFAPGATIQVTPARKLQTLSIAVWASPDIRVPNPSGGLPAYPVYVEVEGRDQAASTGQAYIADKPAVGKILLTNLSDQPVEISAGSVVATTQDPVIRFVISQAVEIPAQAGAQVEVEIVAEKPGLAGNVAAGMIQTMEGPAGMLVAVDNPTATRRGTDRRVPAPSLNDERLLREKMLEELEVTALEELQARLLPGQRLLMDSIRIHEITDESRDPAGATPGDVLLMTVRVEFEAWLIDEADLQTVSQAALDATLEKGFQPVRGSLRYAFQGEPVVEESGGSSGNLVARGTLNLDRILETEVSRERAIEAIRGRTVSDAHHILQSTVSTGRAPVINLFPAWWSRLPVLPFRIVVVTP